MHRTRNSMGIVANMSRYKGFTIVELIIVVVVIAILAAITVVAYNGMRQKANNAARISAAGQVIKLIGAWRVGNDDAYVPSSGCLTLDGSCTRWDGVVWAGGSAATDALQQVGRPPQSVPQTGTDRYGIYYNLRAVGMTFNDQPARVLVMYWLDGTNQQCGVANVATQGVVDGSHPDPWLSSTNGRSGNFGSKTVCYVAM